MSRLFWMALFAAMSTHALAAETPVVPGQVCGSEALGTRRTLAVGTEGGVEVGLKSYPQTLPLADHEVALTFDDGPTATTAAVLDALKAACVKATFFMIGRHAEAAPDLVRRALAEGHTLAHHTFSHPAATLRRMTTSAAEADIDRGIAADEMAAYGTSSAAPRVPFFRFPGFADTPELRGWLAARNIAVFGADVWAMDWLDLSPRAELDILMRHLEREKRGIILLHDTRASTAAMVPDLLRTLKAKGYKVVHLVPGAGRQTTTPAPKGWTSETDRVIAEVFERERERRVARLASRARPGGSRSRAANDAPWLWARPLVHLMSKRHHVARQRNYGAAKRTRTSTGLPTSTSS